MDLLSLKRYFEIKLVQENLENSSNSHKFYDFKRCSYDDISHIDKLDDGSSKENIVDYHLCPDITKDDDVGVKNF
jgi:hypothetical protein